MPAIPRIVVAAPSSGHGKSAVATGLLAALRGRGLRTAAFKIGPDYVDAAYLGMAADRPARNLDPRMTGSASVGPLFVHGATGAEIAIIEGTMGLYDGLTGRTDVESTAQIAGLLRAPVVMVVDVAAMGQSVAALVHGFRAYDEMLWLGGVILNRVASARHEQLLREALADIAVPVLGALHRDQLVEAALPARLEGVVPVVARSVAARRAVRRLGETVAASVNLERLLSLAQSAPHLVAEAWSPEAGARLPARPKVQGLPGGQGLPGVQGLPGGQGLPGDDEDPSAALAVVTEALGRAQKALSRGAKQALEIEQAPEIEDVKRAPVIAVAGREHCWYGYQETVELLVAAGAEVAPVDPLRDERLPEGTAGLIIAGALPEAYTEELAGNTALLRAVRSLAGRGAPIVAEAAGVALLLREYDGRPMAGVLNATGRPGEHLVLGYREAIAHSVSPLVPRGTRVVGYRQHRGVTTPRAGAEPAWSWPSGEPEGFVRGRIHASYLCLHWAGVPGLASRLVAATGIVPAPPTPRPPADPPPAEPPPPEPPDGTEESTLRLVA